jgi:hypothetical protein
LYDGQEVLGYGPKNDLALTGFEPNNDTDFNFADGIETKIAVKIAV